MGVVNTALIRMRAFLIFLFTLRINIPFVNKSVELKEVLQNLHKLGQRNLAGRGLH